MNGLLGTLRSTSSQLLDSYLRFSRLLVDTGYWTVIAPLRGRGLRWESTVRHCVVTGFNAIPIVLFITLLIGYIMGLQSATQTSQFGLNSMVPTLVGVSMTRELGPLITAIVLSGRSGSAFAAEIGTMVVQEEIDALRTMGLNPIKFLVVPKVIAMAIMEPVLSLMANIAGMFGGWLVCTVNLDLTTTFFIQRTVDTVSWGDVYTGAIKAVIFGLIIATVGCYYGFNVRGGAEGVGSSTTATVVTSIFLVIVADGVFTLYFFVAGA